MTEERWQRSMYWPLNIGSVVFLIAYSWRVIADLQPPAGILLSLLLLAVWILFAVHFFVGLALAPHRGRWFAQNWSQLIFVVLPALQPVRLLRLVPVIMDSRRGRGAALRTKIAAYLGFTLVLVLYIGAVMVLDAEQNADGATIRSFGDAVWWAVVTVTTVGYGDFTPVTIQGRLIAGGLMFSGIAVIGMVTGSLASYITERARADDPSKLTASQAQVEELQRQVSELNERLGGGSSAHDSTRQQ